MNIIRNIKYIYEAVVILIKLICLLPFLAMIKLSDAIKPKVALSLLILQNEAETLFIKSKKKNNDN